jgi:hypothetical protein
MRRGRENGEVEAGYFFLNTNIIPSQAVKQLLAYRAKREIQHPEEGRLVRMLLG